MNAGRYDAILRGNGRIEKAYAATNAKEYFAEVTEVCTAFGRRGLPAHKVAQEASDAAQAYLQHDAPVGEHLADQLLLPLALLAGGEFRTAELSSHARTNIETLETFLPGCVHVDEVRGGLRVRVRARD